MAPRRRGDEIRSVPPYTRNTTRRDEMVTRPTAPAPETLPDSVRKKLEHDVIQAMASDDPAGELCRVVERTVLEHEVGRRTESGWCRLAAEISDAVFEVLPDGRISAIHGGRDRAMVNAITAASGRPLVQVTRRPGGPDERVADRNADRQHPRECAARGHFD